MVSLLESPANRQALQHGDLPGQIRHCFRVLSGDREFSDLGSLFQAARALPDADLASASKSLRDRGNKLYGRRELAAAAKEYTRSVLAAPVDPRTGAGREAALGLGNRSAAFFEAGRFGDCLEDVAAALDFGYPAELRYKLHDRRGRCLAAQGDAAGAKGALEEALEALKSSNLKENRRSELEKDIKAAVDEVIFFVSEFFL